RLAKTMRKQAILETLPPEERQQILQLCAKNTYSAVLTIVARPRSEGGLALSTNRASLCRFVQKQEGEILDDRLQSIRQRLKELDPENPLNYPAAIAQLMQERIFASLDAEEDFRKIHRELTDYLALKRLNLNQRNSTSTQL